MRILIVDDNSICAEILRRTLERELKEMAICDITVCYSAEDVLHEFKKGARYDIIFTDIEMGPISGEKMAEDIRDRYGGDIRIVAVTSTHDTKIPDQYKSAGISNCLNKPADCNLVRIILEDTIAKMDACANSAIP
jgi:CheY-like chemotaxis protein